MCRRIKYRLTIRLCFPCLWKRLLGPADVIDITSTYVAVGPTVSKVMILNLRPLFLYTCTVKKYFLPLVTAKTKKSELHRGVSRELLRKPWTQKWNRPPIGDTRQWKRSKNTKAQTQIPNDVISITRHVICDKSLCWHVTKPYRTKPCDTNFCNKHQIWHDCKSFTYAKISLYQHSELYFIAALVTTCYWTQTRLCAL